MSKKPYGWIYRISHKDIIKKCYIGRTVVSIEKRFQEHIREANKRNKHQVSDAKLHSIMWAHKPETFDIEMIDAADSLFDLKEKEILYQKKFDSIDNGWNINKAADSSREKEQNIKIIIKGKVYISKSLASLCRELGISNSTVNFWRRKKFSDSDSIEKAQSAKKATNQKGSIIVFRQEFKDVNKLAKSKLNKNKLSPSTIRKRYKKLGTYEEALLKKLNKPQVVKIKFEKENLIFKNATVAHNFLSNKIKNIAPYSSVITSHSNGNTWEIAFGINKPEWHSYYENLINKEGYKLTGELKKESTIVIDKKNKEIFSTGKKFANTYGYDYTTISAELKSGLKPFEIISKRKG